MKIKRGSMSRLVLAVSLLLLLLQSWNSLAWELAPHGTAPEPPYLAETTTPPLRTTVRVTTVDDLAMAVWNLQSDTTIIVAPGTYRLNDVSVCANGVDGRLTVGRWNEPAVQRVEIRGETGNPDHVTIQGDATTIPTCLHVYAAQHLVVSGLTMETCRYHVIQVDAGGNSHHIQFHSLILRNAGQQVVKINGHALSNSSLRWSRISNPSISNEECSTANALQINGQHAGFTVEHVTIDNFACSNSASPGPAILAWNGATDTVVNAVALIGMNSVGIALGYVDRSGTATNRLDHTGGRITNCMITSQAAALPAVLIDSPSCLVAHNTVWTANTPIAMETKLATTMDVSIYGNLINGGVLLLQGSQAITQHTVDVPNANWLVDVATGDLRLSPAGQAAVLTVPRHGTVVQDFDDRARANPTTAGAVEYQAVITHAPSNAPTFFTAAPTIEPAPIVLQNMVPEFVSAQMDGLVRLMIYLEPTTVAVYCAIGAGSGDADLLGRWNYPVSIDNLYANDCVPFKHGNSEQCTPTDFGPRQGDVIHFGLFAYRGFTNVQVICLLYDTYAF